MSNKLHWAKWFWSDWAGDAALNLCSLPARGLWMALLCLAAQGEPYGTVTIKGRAPTRRELFRLIAPRGTRSEDFDRWLKELIDRGVASVDREGVLSSPRMKRDGALHAARAEAAKKKWEKADVADDLHMQNPGDNADLHMQTDSFASIEPKPHSNHKESPPTPPRGVSADGVGKNGGEKKGGREPRNAFVDHAAEIIQDREGGPEDRRVIPMRQVR